MGKTFVQKLRIMKIDMTREVFTLHEATPEFSRKYIGGTGLGARLLLDLVPFGTHSLDPENVIVWTTGPLTGTGAPGSGFSCIVTLGPLSNSLGSAQSQGLFGAFMRFAGVDAMAITGAAKDWRILHIKEGKVQFADAAPIMGLDVWNTDDTVKRMYGLSDHNSSVACIGPAGEHLVRYAAVFNDKGHVLSTNGPGCVMGSKKLKAVIVETSGRYIPVANRESFNKLRWEWALNEKQGPMGKTIGTRGTWGDFTGMAVSGCLPVKNYTTRKWDNYEDFTGLPFKTINKDRYEFTRKRCYGCPFNHCGHMKFIKGKYAGFECDEPEYETATAMSGLIGNFHDPEGAVYLTGMLDRLGLCAKECGFTLAMAIEAYEGGILTKEQTGGVELTWGNVDEVDKMLKLIAYRKGFGNVLAEGVRRASHIIGRGAEEMGVYFKGGIAPHIHDQRSQWGRIAGFMLSDYGANMCNPVETTIEKNLGIDTLAKAFDLNDIMKNFYKLVPRRMVDDCWGVCMFLTYIDLELPRKTLNSVTGWNVDYEEIKEFGFRITNLMRCFNLLHGKMRDDDMISPRLAIAPTDGPNKVEPAGPVYREMGERFYKMMGWDVRTSIPLPKTLSRYGLEDVADKMREAGLYDKIMN